MHGANSSQYPTKPAMASPVRVPAMVSPVRLPAPSAATPHSGAVPALPSPALCRRGRRRGGFTLTELLIVIAIIGVLASLITAAAMNALRAGRRARIALEIKNVTASMEDFKNQFGTYPPNGMSGNYNNTLTRVVSDFERMAKKAFPRINPQELEVFRAIGGKPNVDSNICPDGALQRGLSAGEALYFWLGGFSDDPQYPLSGPGGPAHEEDVGEVLENRRPRYEFALTRLGPQTDGELDPTKVRTLRFILTKNGAPTPPLAIRFWRFYPDGSEHAYVYLDTSRYKPAQYQLPAYDNTIFTDEPPIYAIPQLRTGLKEPSSDGKPNDLVFANQRKFQILHCGIDDAWGEGFAAFGQLERPAVTNSNDVITFPEGPFLGELADTMTNFTDGTLEDAQEE
jgi:prepilin-type N-terminal cleavage/methylation domain-containing protein